MAERLGGGVAPGLFSVRIRALGDYARSRSAHRTAVLLLRAGAVAASVAGLLDFVVAPLQGRFTGQFEDYQDYAAAASAATHRTDIYASFLNHAQPIPVQGFDYPPIVAWLLQPFAWMPASTAATVWLLLLVACTVAATAIIAYELLPATWPRLELTALFTFVYAPATYSFWHGQMSAIVLLFLALALRSWMRGRQVSLGVFIGVAACIKIAPILLVVLLVRRRYWTACASLAVTLAVGIGGGVVALGAGTLRDYVTKVLPVLTWQNGWVYNQSAAGAANRLLAHSVLAFQPTSLLITVITAAVAVAAIGVTAVVVRREEVPREIRGAQFALGVLAMLLAGSVTWFWHLNALLIVLAACAALVASKREWRRRSVVITGIAVLVASGFAAPVLISVGSMPALTALSHSWGWWPALQLISAPAFAMAAFFVVLAYRLWRAAPSTRTS
jgi:alpha-1,2-mannosyltransferase